jgi:nucleotide-binding universal stress UspA family protein
MSSPRPIVVATDLNVNADDAIVEAHALALHRGVPLVVVHGLPEFFGIHPLFPQLNVSESFSLASVERKAGEAVSRRVTELTGRQAGAFEVFLETGSPHSAILEVAERSNAELIVVGAHGGGLEGILGNVTRQVVRHAHASVLVVRAPASDRKGEVLIATDFSPSAGYAITEGQREAERLGRKVTLLYSLDFVPQRYAVPFIDAPLPSSGDMADMQRELSRMLADEASKIGATPQFRTGPASQAIAETAGEIESPLVVVATHGRTGIGRLALGSVAEKVVEKAPCSVLVARSH